MGRESCTAARVVALVAASVFFPVQRVLTKLDKSHPGGRLRQSPLPELVWEQMKLVFCLVSNFSVDWMKILTTPNF